MYFKKFAALAVAAVAAASSMVSTANATYFTSNGTVEVASPAVPAGPLAGIISLSGPSDFGSIYTNQINGVSSITGDIRTVSAQIITSARLPQQFVQFAPYGANRGLVAISAVSGELDSPGVAEFDEGTLFLLDVDLLTFNTQDPSTWTLPGNTIVSTYTLAAPDNVIPGSAVGIAPSGAIVPQSASVINLSSIAAIPGAPQGQFLFQESTGTSFVRDVEGAGGLGDGLLIQIGQIVNPNSTGSTLDGNPLNGGDMDVLNYFAGLAGFSDLGGAGTGFSTGFAAANGAPSAAFYADPAGLGTGGSGDFFAALSSTAYIVAVVPEPSSIALLSLGLVGLGAVGLRNRKNAK